MPTDITKFEPKKGVWYSGWYRSRKYGKRIPLTGWSYNNIQSLPNHIKKKDIVDFHIEEEPILLGRFLRG